MQFRCPNCNQSVDIADEPLHLNETLEELTCPSCHSRFSYSGVDTETMIPEAGKSVGHFEINPLVGTGSYGAVFQAWDSRLERRVALKIPREGRLASDSGKRFLREAQAAGRIQHPNVVSVHEVGQADDVTYIVSELIDGVSLSQWMRHRTLTFQEIAQLMKQVCEAVQAAHEKQIIHRDLKPGNILIDAEGVPYVTDFGLARREHPTDFTVTRHGVILGTPAYMSPEQASGTTASAVSDVYSLGVILFELLAGKRPFAATDSQTLLYRIVNEDAVSPRRLRPEIPKDLETICLKAMQREPHARYPTAAELAADLQRYLNEEPIHARPIGIGERLLRRIRKHPVAAAAWSGCAVLLLLVVIQAVQGRGQDPAVTAGVSDSDDLNVTIQLEQDGVAPDRVLCT